MADALSRLAVLHLSLHNTTALIWPLIRASTRLDLSYKSGIVSNSQPNRVSRSQPNRVSRLKVHAVVAEESDGPKWWERNAGPNMIDIHSTEEFLNALSQAGDRLVIVEFYGTWCGSCRALFPKLCKTAEEHTDIMFLKVNFDENKPMCRSLNVRVLPFFHFYRGADGLLESFSCSLAKFQKLKDAIATHNTPRCSIGPTLGVGNLLESASLQEKPTEERAHRIPASSEGGFQRRNLIGFYHHHGTIHPFFRDQYVIESSVLFSESKAVMWLGFYV